MVNGFRCYRALESVSIASALSTALTIYPCQIRVHQRWQSKLQLPTLGRRSDGRPQRAVHPMRLPVNTVIHTYFRPRTRNLPIVGWLLVRRATSSATDSPVLSFSWLWRSGEEFQSPTFCNALIPNENLLSESCWTSIGHWSSEYQTINKHGQSNPIKKTKASRVQTFSHLQYLHLRGWILRVGVIYMCTSGHVVECRSCDLIGGCCVPTPTQCPISPWSVNKNQRKLGVNGHTTHALAPYRGLAAEG